MLSLLVLAAAALFAAGCLRRLRRVLASRPVLPPEDAPPVGLSRLVPVGRDLDRDIARGIDQLTEYLILHRRRTGAA